MKIKFFTIFLAALFAMQGIVSNAQTSPKLYVVFENFEDEKDGNGTPITNLWESFYYDPITNSELNPNYYELVEKANFPVSDITKYDLAIFPLGGGKGLDYEVGGVKVIDKINEMLNAGKSVLIIGHNVLSQTLINGTTESQKFLQEKLGIENGYVSSLMDGNTIKGFRVYGIEGDPVSEGYYKVGNVEYMENEINGFPWRYYGGLESLRKFESSSASVFDQLIKVRDDTITSNFTYCGIRSEVGQSRLVLWSYNWDIITGVHNTHMHKTLVNALRWATQQYPNPWGQVTAQQNNLDFGNVAVGNKKNLELKVYNSGRQDVTITGMEFGFGTGAFEVVEGNEEVTLAPGEQHVITVQFSPTEDSDFNDYLEIYTTAVVNKTLSIEVKGLGGTGTVEGPHINFSALEDEPLDFGSVDYTEHIDVPLQIYNIGNQELIINDINFIENESNYFSWPQIVTWPQKAQPGSFYSVMIRFTANDAEGGNYTAKLNINTNALNKEDVEVVLVARGLPEGTQNEFELSATEHDFGDVIMGESSNFTFTVTNPSEKPVILSSTKFIGDPENLAQFSFESGEVKGSIVNLGKDDKHDIVVKFEPEAAKEYGVTLKIASNVGNVDIPITGIGKSDGYVNEKGETVVDGLIKMKLTPNVANEKSVLTYEIIGNVSRDIEMNLVDVNGNEISKIFSGSANPGVHLTEINTSAISTGYYMLNAVTEGKNVSVPLVIVR